MTDRIKIGLITFAVMTAYVVALNLYANKSAAGVWFCGDGHVLTDPCMGGTP